MTDPIYQIYWTLMKYHKKNDEAEQKLEGRLNLYQKLMGIKQNNSKQHCKPKLLF